VNCREVRGQTQDGLDVEVPSIPRLRRKVHEDTELVGERCRKRLGDARYRQRRIFGRDPDGVKFFNQLRSIRPMRRPTNDTV